MKLRTKVLLGVVLLFIAMAVIMYILPAYLVRKDVYKAADEIHAFVLADHELLVKSQEIWLSDTLVRVSENLNSLLLMIYKEKDLSALLQLDDNNPITNVWDKATQIAGFDPAVGFVQLHSLKNQKTAVLTPYAAQPYPVLNFERKGSHPYITLQVNEKQKPKTFIGVELPPHFQPPDGYIFYALINPTHLEKKLTVLSEEFSQTLAKPSPAPKIDYSIIEETNPAYQWATKIDMIRSLSQFYDEGLKLDPDAKEQVFPQGIARVDSIGNGYALLSNEIFHQTPFFNEQKYFESHLPLNANPALANGVNLITDKVGDYAYIGNTVLLDSTFLTIAEPLSYLSRQLALSSDKIILLKIDGDFWLGFDANGKRLPKNLLQTILVQGLTDNKKGMLSLDGRNYLFSQLSSQEEGRLIFYVLQPLDSERSIVGTLLNLEHRLSQKISLQLSLVAIGAMILILIFIGRIGINVIYPVTKLAQATQHVVAGRYQEVVLPNMGKRKDEIAILIHSFSDMVKGLEEREKIRGVLDKVVSKDVADEILRTQIHLGGEDRIVTMLFSDIRGFTHLTADMPPQKTIQMLNACMTKISRVIEGEGGVIDKYVGDEVMAIYGAPTKHPDHALRAVSSGLLIIETLKKWNLERVAGGSPPIEMGIGVHTGLVVAGNMGAEDRLNYTVLGANVNLAARLCEASGANQLLISENTLKEPNVSESFHVNPLSPISLKGFAKPIQVYEVIGFKWA